MTTRTYDASILENKRFFQDGTVIVMDEFVRLMRGELPGLLNCTLEGDTINIVMEKDCDVNHTTVMSKFASFILDMDRTMVTEILKDEWESWN